LVIVSATDSIEWNSKSSQFKAPSRWRFWSSTALTVLFCLSSVLSIIGVWANNQIVDTNRFVRTVSPLAYDPAIQAALSDRVSTQISSLIGDLFTRDAESDRDRLLAAPLQSAVDGYINQTVQGFVTSDRFPPMWVQMAKSSHTVAAAVLTGASSASVSSTNGQITIDIAPLLNEVLARLDERGISLASRIQTDNWDTTFVVFQSDSLATQQDLVHTLGRLATILPIVAIVSLLGAIAISMKRRRTIIGAGLGLAVSMAIFLIVLSFARVWTVGELPSSVSQNAATAFFEIIGRYLRNAARLLALAGLLVAAIAFFVRPSGWVKHKAKLAWHWMAGFWHRLFAGISGWSQSGFAAHPMGVAIAIGVVVCLFAVSWDPLSVNIATAIMIGTVVAYGLLWLLHHRAQEAMQLASPVAPIPAINPIQVLPVVSQATEVSIASPTLQDSARADLVALSNELPAEDVQLLTRVAKALSRASGQE
jgi:hypothetical protein